MSQSIALNWPELQSVLEPFIRQIVQDELTKLVKTATSPDKLARKRILLNTSVWTAEE